MPSPPSSSLFPSTTLFRSLEIVHAVRIYLGRDHADDQLVFMRLVNHLCDFQREVAAHLLQYGIHFRIAEYDLAGELLMIRIEDRFKTVGKWAEIGRASCRERCMCVMVGGGIDEKVRM